MTVEMRSLTETQMTKSMGNGHPLTRGVTISSEREPLPLKHHHHGPETRVVYPIVRPRSDSIGIQKNTY